MSSASGQKSDQFQTAAQLETDLLTRVERVRGRFERVECLDEEQRAEIHTILEALRHEGECRLKALAGEYRHA